MGNEPQLPSSDSQVVDGAGANEASRFKAVVVGAYGGIGQATCKAIKQAGGEAFLIGRDTERLQALATEYGWGHFVGDASDWEGMVQAAVAADAHLGGYHSVIHLAGSVLLKPIHLTSRAEWDSVINTNLTSAAGVLRAFVPKFKDGGSVVLMSSSAASIGLSNHEAIAAAKGGIEGLVRSAAMSYAAKRIRVNAIAPGLVQTALTQRVWSNPRSAEVSLGMHPLGRFGEPEDIARGILFLADPRNDWVTGQVLQIDGGLGSLKAMSAASRTG
jgi:NAD(P)-dependent dehydrogenase (short-subunit alcohol dehydrogenase family)